VTEEGELKKNEKAIMMRNVLSLLPQKKEVEGQRVSSSRKSAKTQEVTITGGMRK